jgi:broad specificity phosphatase PhoE
VNPVPGSLNLNDNLVESLTGIIVSAPENGVPEWGLAPSGRDQVVRSAMAFLGSLHRHELESVRVFHSDFKRTKETAELFASWVPTAYLSIVQVFP